MKIALPFMRVLIIAAALAACGPRDHHPMTLPDKPADTQPRLLFKMQKGDAAKLRFLEVRLVYTASNPGDPLLDKDTECIGNIFHGRAYQCREVTDEESRRGWAYFDGPNEQLIVPYEAELDIPGKYQLARVELRPISAERFAKDGVYDDRNAFINATISVRHDVEELPDTPLMLARHRDPTWNMTIEPRPATAVLYADPERIFPYAANDGQLRAFTSRHISDRDPVPTAYVDQHNRVIDSALSGLPAWTLNEYCAGPGTEVTETVRSARILPRLSRAALTATEDGKRCLHLRNDNGDEFLVHTLKDQVYVRQVWDHAAGLATNEEGLAGLWAGGKLIYAAYGTRKRVKEDWIATSLFYDEPYGQIYPDARARFPMARLEKSRSKADALLTLKLP